MAIPNWPATLPIRPKAQSLSAAPRRMVASFEPEQGLEITRPRITAAIHVLNFDTPALSTSQAAILRAFLEDECRGGATAFSWLDPRTDELWLWKPVPGDGPYKESDLGGGYSAFALSLVRQPGRPWWSTYGYTGRSEVPLLVLDFDNTIHGQPPTKSTLAALTAAAPVLGVVDLYRVSSAAVVSLQLSVTVDAAWWAALVPASWDRIVAFPAGTLV